MNRIKFFSALSAAMLLLVAYTSGSQSIAGTGKVSCFKETPLPPLGDIIILPEDDVSSGIARFLGIWTDGRWSYWGFDDPQGFMCNTLVVSQLYRDGTADIIYSFGASSQGSVQPGWWTSQGKAKVSGDTLDLRTGPGGNSVFYVIDESGPEPVLKGTYQGYHGGEYYVTLRKHK